MNLSLSSHGLDLMAHGHRDDPSDDGHSCRRIDDRSLKVPVTILGFQLVEQCAVLHRGLSIGSITEERHIHMFVSV